ncbi:MAG: orotate phosphoribosyltransferase [Candidatus Cloacimonas sp.]
MEENELITIATYTNPFEAELAKGFLEESGFHPYLLNERMMSMYASIAGDMYKIELQVPENEEHEAKELITGLEDSDYVTKILHSEGALLKGHFQLTSGKHSKQYIEKIRILQNPAAAHNLCKLLANRLADYDFDAIVGPAYGGIALAFDVALLMNKSFLFTQRKDGEMTLRSGFDLSKIRKTVIVEDILTTGGSIQEVINCLENKGLEVIAIGVLVDRSGGNVQFSLPMEPLLSLDIPAYEPENCDACKQSIPLIKPGSSDKV